MLCSNIQYEYLQNSAKNGGTKYSNITFPLPTVLCVGYSVMLRKYFDLFGEMKMANIYASWCHRALILQHFLLLLRFHWA